MDVKDYITQPIDLIDFSRREAQGYIGVFVVAAFLFLVGFLVQMYFFFSRDCDGTYRSLHISILPPRGER